MSHRELKEEDYQTIMAFIHEAHTQGTHYAGQSYEDGMAAVIDVMEENMSAAEACE